MPFMLNLVVALTVVSTLGAYSLPYVWGGMLPL